MNSTTTQQSLIKALSFTFASVGMLASAAEPTFWSWAKTPPMGWNSWDCYGAGVWESNVLANADYMAEHLKPHGWEVITIDIQWYEPLAHTTGYRRGAVLEMDANGRLLPAPNRFPMTAGTHSFKPIADYLHAKGLKFGLHLMRGIPRQAVDRGNSPVLGSTYKAGDIVNTNSRCAWNTDMYGVDMTKPGAQEYYDSVFVLLASWDLDYVKVDDLSRPYHKDEIEAIRKAIDKNQNSTNNRQLFNTNNTVAWSADVPGSKDKYVALFNTSPTPAPRGKRSDGVGGPATSTNALATDPAASQPREISVSVRDLGFSGAVKVRDLWNHKELGVVNGSVTQTINSHGAGLYRVQPQG